ncbi:hypothetical protein VNI00_004504 [Paramarasmius palmivorus]|uniref:Uncharacterized protein n=1 Tax=Paramarasmius palmivorus TaxID=297713 RepID=A0AAW0DI38_9AGAR
MTLLANKPEVASNALHDFPPPSMASFFACCFRRKPIRRVIVDEESRLIPDPPQVSTSETLPSFNVYGGTGLDKERLGGIVQAKQGKMVNVSAFVPFNLHTSASSSHSPARAPSTARYAFPAPVSPLTPTHSDVQAQGESPAMSRNGSSLERNQPPPGWDSNMRRTSLAPSESETSLHQPSRGPVLMRSGSFHRQPVLGLRLVSGSGNSGSMARRGRARVKGVSGGLGLTFTAGRSASGSASEDNGGSREHEDTGAPVPPVPPAPTSSSTNAQPSSEATVLHPPKLVTTTQPFTLRDIGNITIGWDD